MHKYAAFNDGIPPSTGVTHIIREETPGTWIIVASIQNQEAWKEMVDQLNMAHDLAATTFEDVAHEVTTAVRMAAGLPVPPVPPSIPKPPIGLVG